MNVRTILASLALAAAVTAIGCKDEHKAGDGHSHNGKTHASAPAQPAGTQPATQPRAADDHPDAVVLGTQTVKGLQLKATQDEPIKAGGEGAFELLITGGKPKAVRFWVGVENGQGSVKAKAEEETADNWHTHVEIPDPLPPGSKFWAEIEPQTGERFRVSFDLKQ